MTQIWLRRRNLKRETESFFIAAQNNVIRTNYVKTKIDHIQRIVSVGYVVIEMKQLIM